jgi:single-stranded DNA-binding protein
MSTPKEHLKRILRMATENTKTDRKFRTRDRFELLGVRVAVVGEPKEINAETTLCECKVVSQSGDERYPDTWVTITGANGLAEKIYGLNKGDRINVAGKPYFRAWLDKEGNPQVSVEIRFPEFVDICARTADAPAKDAPAAKGKTVVEEPEADEEETEEVPAKKPVGRPAKKVTIKAKAPAAKGKAAELFSDDDDEE